MAGKWKICRFFEKVARDTQNPLKIRHVFLTHCWLFGVRKFFVLSIKRKKEFENNISSRISIKKYNTTILNLLIYLSLAFSIFSYVIYLYSKNSELFITLPIVILCLFRYLYVTSITNKGEFPIDIFFRDWVLLLLVIIYTLIVMINSI